MFYPTFKQQTISAFSIGVALLVAGCDSRPARVPIPKVDPYLAGDTAVQAYDRDGDQLLSQSELQQSPPLLMKLAVIDTNGDRCLSADEIRQRIEAWMHTRVGFVTGYKCKVLENGRPLSGASVELIPEEFLGGAVNSASGTTDKSGYASLSIANANLPEDLQGLRGVQFGFYRVKITHPTRSIENRYNTATLFGCEVYPSGDPETLTYNMKTR